MLATIFSGKGKIMDVDCWREVVNPHFAGADFTENAFEEWKSGRSNKKFAEWLDSEYLPCLLTFGSYSTKDKSIANKIHSTKVEYMNEVDRKFKEVIVQNGVFFNHLNQKYDTQHLSTTFSGNGWGIFVMDINNKIYVGPHKPAEFHHSSFLSGGRVLAAGEIAINNGQLASITNKSGHYKPNERNFYTILYFLHHQGVNLKNIPAVVNFDKPVKYFDAYEVMLNAGKAIGLTEIAAPLSIRAVPIQTPQKSKGYLQPIIKHRQAPPPPPVQAPQGSKGYLHPIVNAQPEHIHHPDLPSEDEIYWDLFYKF